MSNLTYRLMFATLLLIPTISAISVNAQILRLDSAVGSGSSAPTGPFMDGFEGPGLNQFWSVKEQSGTIRLSNEQAHGGTQSIKFTSSAVDQREMILQHVF